MKWSCHTYTFLNDQTFLKRNKSLKDNTILIYLLSELRFKEFERTIDPFEKQFKIDLNKRTILSKKDKKGMTLEYLKKNIKTL